jgi:hypothetical protein
VNTLIRRRALSTAACRFVDGLLGALGTLNVSGLPLGQASPPAMLGTIVIVSVSLSGVRSPWRWRTSSSFR